MLIDVLSRYVSKAIWYNFKQSFKHPYGTYNINDNRMVYIFVSIEHVSIRLECFAGLSCVYNGREV